MKLPPLEPGVHAYVGETQTGKTTLALQELTAFMRAQRCGAIIVDSGSATNFRAYPHVANAADAIRGAWHGQLATWTPRDKDEWASLWTMVERAEGKGGARTPVAILVDEVSFWPKSKAFENVLRTWAHKRVTLFVTSQRITKDLGETFLACGPRVRMFRMTAPLTLRLMKNTYNVPWEHVQTLRTGEYVYLRLGDEPIVVARRET